MKFPSYQNIISTLGKIGLIVGVIISLIIAIQFATTSIFPEAEREDFCPSYQDLGDARSEEMCLAIDNAEWQGNPDRPQIADDPNILKDHLFLPHIEGHCSETNECREAFENARDRNKTHQFVFALGLSLVALLIGVFALSGSAATALVWTGVISMLFSLQFVPHDRESLIAIAAAVVGVILLVVLSRKQKQAD